MAEIIPALDVRSVDVARGIVSELGTDVYAYKVGYSLILGRNAGLPAALDMLDEFDCAAMVDAKMHDIPDTMINGFDGLMEDAVLNDVFDSYDGKKPELITVHCDNGPRALTKLNEKVLAGNKEYGTTTRLVGVTVLTSYDNDECERIYGKGMTVEKMVKKFAGFAVEAGLLELVSSAQDLQHLAGDPDFDKLTKNTPAVRPLWAATNDQARPFTPADAVRAGADRLIIGRPLIAPPKEIGSPSNALELIKAEVEAA